MVKRLSALFLVLAAAASSAFAAELSIDWQKNVAAQDPANDYFTFKGPSASVDKDRFDPKKVVGAVTGASQSGSTAAFNVYRSDQGGKTLMPASLRNLFLFSVAADSVRSGDALSAAKAPSGIITVRFVHRGSAYEIVTDAKGQLVLPTTAIKTRKIGLTDNTVAADFSPTGKVDKLDWAKVWDPNVPDGAEVKSADGKSSAKTGKIAADLATSESFVWGGTLQFSFDGKLLKIVAALDQKKK